MSSPNHIESPESDYLFTGVSQILNAGQGLFTAIAIYKEETIAIYKGEILTQLEARNRADEGNDKYFISLGNGRIMDSMHTDCFAKYANDALGFSGSKFKNNALISLDDNGDVCLTATAKIKKGQEIFCNYGKAYWKKQNSQ